MVVILKRAQGKMPLYCFKVRVTHNELYFIYNIFLIIIAIEANEELQFLILVILDKESLLGV